MKTEAKKVKPIRPYSDQWRREAINLAFSVVDIHPCGKCGHPVMNGYCCGYCGDSNPNKGPNEN